MAHQESEISRNIIANSNITRDTDS